MIIIITVIILTVRLCDNCGCRHTVSICYWTKLWFFVFMLLLLYNNNNDNNSLIIIIIIVIILLMLISMHSHYHCCYYLILWRKYSWWHWWNTGKQCLCSSIYCSTVISTLMHLVSSLTICRHLKVSVAAHAVIFWSLCLISIVYIYIYIYIYIEKECRVHANSPIIG